MLGINILYFFLPHTSPTSHQVLVFLSSREEKMTSDEEAWRHMVCGTGESDGEWTWGFGEVGWEGGEGGAG